MTVYVVTGPPASGKTTWVREHAKPGDITIDYDTLAQALSPGLAADPLEQPANVAAFVNVVRACAIDEATLGITDRNIYLVHAMPARQHLNRYRKHGFEIIIIDPGYTECMRRAQQRTPRQQGIVVDWYERRGLTT